MFPVAAGSSAGGCVSGSNFGYDKSGGFKRMVIPVGVVMSSERVEGATSSVAAIVYGPGSRIEEFLAQIAALLKHRGIAIAGLLQHSMRAGVEDRCAFEMEDLWSGRRYSISQDLGPGSDACSIDHTAIASASMVLRRAIDAHPDVVLVNKFGALEAAGDGLRSEMTQVVAADLPLLTTVNAEQLAAWREYAGGEGCELPMDANAVLAWVDAHVRGRASQIA